MLRCGQPVEGFQTLAHPGSYVSSMSLAFTKSWNYSTTIRNVMPPTKRITRSMEQLRSEYEGEHYHVAFKTFQTTCPLILLLAYLFSSSFPSNLTTRVFFVRAAFIAQSEDMRKQLLRTPQIASLLRHHWRGLDGVYAAALTNVNCGSYGTPRLLDFLRGQVPPCVGWNAKPRTVLLPMRSGCRTTTCLRRVVQPLLEFKPVHFLACGAPQDFLGDVLERHFSRALREVPEGLLLEFGTSAPREGWSTSLFIKTARRIWRKHWEGGSSRQLLDPHLFAFDTFSGLPTNWRCWQPGAFKLDNGSVPDIAHLGEVADHIHFVPGLFADTLPSFLAERVRRAAEAQQPPPKVQVAFLDADLYEATKEVLVLLSPFLTKGSLLVFDDVICGGCRCRDEAVTPPETWCLDRNESRRLRTKEVWEALAEALVLQPFRRWQIEILGADWSVHRKELCQSFRLALRVVK